MIAQLLGAVSSLRSNTEPEDELEAGRTSFLDAISASLLNESCDGDVEDETLPELGRYSWNEKRYEIVSFEDNTVPICGQPWLLTADHSWEYPWSSQTLPSDGTAGASSGTLHGDEQI